MMFPLKDMARKYNLCVSTIRGYCLSGDISCIRQGRMFLCDEDELRQLIIRKKREQTGFAGSFGYECAESWDSKKYIKILYHNKEVGRIYLPISWVEGSSYTVWIGEKRECFASLKEAKQWAKEEIMK